MAHCGVALLAVLMAACSDQPTASTLAGARLELIPEIDPSSLILVDPHSAELQVNHGIIIRARVLDGEGEVMPDARPAWRTTNAAVAATHALPDSVAAPGARVAVAGVAPGQAYVIASYANLADTTIITVVPRPDSTGQTPPPPPPAPAPRPTTFDATITVLGFVPGADTSVTGSTLVPGAIVTLTLLPPMAGDTLPTGITPVTTPIMFGTVTVNAQSQARFSAVPQSRFRIDVVTSADSPWQGASHTSGPPIVATYGRLVTLQKR